MNKLTAGKVQGKSGHWSLRFVVALAVLTVISAAGCNPTGSALNASQEAAMRDVRQTATVAADLLNVYMDARATEMLVCAATCEHFGKVLTDPETSGKANRTLGDWLKISRGLDAVMLLDRTGACVASAPAAFVNHDFSADSTFKGAIAGKPTFSHVHKSDALISVDPESNGWTAAIAVPIRVGNDWAGVLMCYLKWSRLNELTNSIQVGKTGYVYVLNHKNQVILHPMAAFYGKGLRDRPINMPDLDAAVRNRLPSTRYDFKNVRSGKVNTKVVGFAYPTGYQNFPGLGWTVAAGADETEFIGGHSLWGQLFR
ncbi:MAG: cache domain-containing protein [Desulfomonilaceae bacterium]|nr:cache domain-containing protein [Desulfomonilaceae bacterium]